MRILFDSAKGEVRVEEDVNNPGKYVVWNIALFKSPLTEPSLNPKVYNRQPEVISNPSKEEIDAPPNSPDLLNTSPSVFQNDEEVLTYTQTPPSSPNAFEQEQADIFGLWCDDEDEQEVETLAVQYSFWNKGTQGLDKIIPSTYEAEEGDGQGPGYQESEEVSAVYDFIKNLGTY